MASLYGIDFSENAIKICEKEYGKFAVFSVGDLGDIEGFYDLIYCSNTLEHFSDFKEKSRQLICHCRQLCIMVPFQELDSKGKPILPNPNNHHQHTFDEASFDFLLAEGLATDIKTEIFSCVGAWGWTNRQKIEQAVKNTFRYLSKRHLRFPPRQILFDISSSNLQG